MTDEELAELSDKAPPHDLDAEQAVLGAMLIEAGAARLGLSKLQTDDFYPEAHRIIFSAMEAAAAGGEPVDLVTVSAELRKVGQIENIGGGKYLVACIGKVPTAAHAPRYLAIVKEASVKRDIIRLASETVEQAGDAELDELITKIQDGALALSAAQTETVGSQPFADIFESFVQWQDALMSQPWAVRGPRFGIPSIDKKLGGLAEHTVVVIRACTKYGKTKLLRQSMLETAQKAGPVLAYILEGNPMMWQVGCVAYLSRVAEYKMMMDGYKRQTDAETKRVVAAWQKLPNIPIYLASDVRSVAALRSDIMAQFESLQEKPVAIYIDYLQCITGPTSNTKTETLNKALEMLAGINERYRVPVITASQVTKKDGRNATRWSQEAEMLPSLLLEIERGPKNSDVRNNPDAARQLKEVRLLPIEQRHGERLSVTELKADWAWGRFYDIAEER